MCGKAEINFSTEQKTGVRECFILSLLHWWGEMLPTALVAMTGTTIVATMLYDNFFLTKKCRSTQTPHIWVYIWCCAVYASEFSIKNVARKNTLIS